MRIKRKTLQMRHELNLGNAKGISYFMAPSAPNALKTYPKEKIMSNIFLVFLIFIFSATHVTALCAKDTDSKGDRICVAGKCVELDKTENLSAILEIKKAQNVVYTFDDLNADEKKKYNNEKLSIETRGKGLGGGSVGSGGAISLSLETWTKWYAYKGFDRISDEAFFLTAGYKEQAFLTKRYKKINLGLLIGGLSCIGIGTAAGIALVDEDAGLYIGLSVMVVGSILGTIGMKGIRGNKFPYSTVIRVADEYNSNLINDIIKKRR